MPQTLKAESQGFLGMRGFFLPVVTMADRLPALQYLSVLRGQLSAIPHILILFQHRIDFSDMFFQLRLELFDIQTQRAMSDFVLAPFVQVFEYFMALSISYCMGSEILLKNT